MDDGYLGEIRFFAGNFAPSNWMYCMGQLLPIAQNQALFSLLGTNYGGDGRVNFALPDFRGRTGISPDSRVGLDVGDMGGQEVVTLVTENIPEHTHDLCVYNQEGNEIVPQGMVIAQPIGNVTVGRDTYPVSSISYSTNVQTTIDMNQGTLSPEGGGEPHNNMQPYIGMNYIICVKGLFPSRS
nr:tail fiber protein [uncultured Draconibacterium sp.]